MTTRDQQLQDLVEAVSSSSKYRQVSPDLIRAIGQRELTIRPSWKAAVKATKNKLHQVGGAYQVTKINYTRALNMLRETVNSPPDFQASCREIMSWHVSTRERLPILDSFYTEILQHVGPVNSVVDVACGFNPLAYSWMPFDKQVKYLAYDIYADAMHLIKEFMVLVSIIGQAEVRDILQRPPTEPVDLVFILKTLPCLEQLDKSASATLLDAIQARHILITYPVTSLGGRSKGMIANYDAHFHRIASGRRWSVKRFEFSTELAFLVETDLE